jgi:hypothetical protein
MLIGDIQKAVESLSAQDRAALLEKLTTANMADIHAGAEKKRVDTLWARTVILPVVSSPWQTVQRSSHPSAITRKMFGSRMLQSCRMAWVQCQGKKRNVPLCVR